MLGSSSWKTFRTVVVPQARGAIAAGGLLVFLYVLSDFGAVSIMRYDTLTRAIYSARLFDQSTAVSLGLMLALLAIAIGYGERWFRSDIDDGRQLTGVPRVYPLGRVAPLASAGIGVVIGVALVVPIAVFLACQAEAPADRPRRSPRVSPRLLLRPCCSPSRMRSAGSVSESLRSRLRSSSGRLLCQDSSLLWPSGSGRSKPRGPGCINRFQC